MGKHKKKQAPIPADLTSGYPHGTIISRGDKSQAPSVPAKTFADEVDPIIADALPEMPEEHTPPLSKAELEHLDAVIGGLVL